MVSSWKQFTWLTFSQLIFASFSPGNDPQKLQIGKLSLFLEPRKFIENYFKMRESGGWSNFKCERHFSSFVAAIRKREIWALKS